MAYDDRSFASDGPGPVPGRWHLARRSL